MISNIISVCLNDVKAVLLEPAFTHIAYYWEKWKGDIDNSKFFGKAQKTRKVSLELWENEY